MTKDQVKKLVDLYTTKATRPDGRQSTLGEYIRFCLDGAIDFVTSKDAIIYDDANNLLHCIAINEDMIGQATFPFKVISCDYGVIQQIEAVMSKKNFDTFLSTSFIAKLMSKGQLDYIKNWASKVRIQAQQPIRATPYYEHEPEITPMPSVSMDRDDGIKVPVSPTPSSITQAVQNAIKANTPKEDEDTGDETGSGETGDENNT